MSEHTKVGPLGTHYMTASDTGLANMSKHTLLFSISASFWGLGFISALTLMIYVRSHYKKPEEEDEKKCYGM